MADPQAPTAQFDPDAIRALLEKLKPPAQTVDLPPPQQLQGVDPELMRQTLSRANTLGMLHGAFGMHLPSTYEVMKSGSAQPTMPPSPSYDAAKASIMQPMQMEQARVDRANQQAGIQNKYDVEKAQLGIESQKANNAIPLAEMKGMLNAYQLAPKLQNAQTVAHINADAKPKVSTVAAGAQPISNQTGQPLGPVNPGAPVGAIPDGIYDREADRYNTTATVQTPKGLRGPQALAFISEVMKRADAKAKAPGSTVKPLALAGADYGADTGSLKKLTPNIDQMNMFEGTAVKNLGVLREALGKISDSGSPLLNKPIRSWDQNVMGQPEIAARNAALRIVTPEVAKVLQSATGTGVLTDTAQKHVDTVLDPNATAAQQLAAIDVILKDFGNRRASAETTKSEIRGRISPSAQTGDVTVRRKRDGMTKTLPADKAQQYLSDSGFEVVK